MPHDIETLIGIMKTLRDPVGGCPWDLRQDFSTIAPYTIEEAYEVADAIERRDFASLCEELGDLLLQVVFHARMAEERGLFDFVDVVHSICSKMVRRHPHVFAGSSAGDPAELARAWEEAKERERPQPAGASLLDDIPRGMPELQRATRMQQRAARAGFDWPAPEPVLAKIGEEFLELRGAMDCRDRAAMQDEMGDLLFAVVNLARHLQLDPAAALRGATAKFEGRFRAVESAAGGREALKAMAPEQMDELWIAAKAHPNEVSS